MEGKAEPQTMEGSISRGKSITEPVLGIEIYGLNSFEVGPTGPTER